MGPCRWRFRRGTGGGGCRGGGCSTGTAPDAWERGPHWPRHILLVTRSRAAHAHTPPVLWRAQTSPQHERRARACDAPRCRVTPTGGGRTTAHPRGTPPVRNRTPKPGQPLEPSSVLRRPQCPPPPPPSAGLPFPPADTWAPVVPGPKLTKQMPYLPHPPPQIPRPCANPSPPPPCASTAAVPKGQAKQRFNAHPVLRQAHARARHTRQQSAVRDSHAGSGNVGRGRTSPPTKPHGAVMCGTLSL